MAIGRVSLPIILVLIAAAPAPAQDSFQSAPAPAPVLRPAPAPPRQAVRPTPRARPTQPAESEQEPAPTVAPAPAAAAASKPPTAPSAPSLAGAWVYTSNCPNDYPTDFYLAPSGRDQYSVSGRAGTAPITGWVSGTVVHLEGSDWLQRFTFNGIIESPTMMRGDVAGNIMPGSCRWNGRKR